MQVSISRTLGRCAGTAGARVSLETLVFGCLLRGLPIRHVRNCGAFTGVGRKCDAERRPRSLGVRKGSENGRSAVCLCVALSFLQRLWHNSWAFPPHRMPNGWPIGVTLLLVTTIGLLTAYGVQAQCVEETGYGAHFLLFSPLCLFLCDGRSSFFTPGRCASDAHVWVIVEVLTRVIG